jgi:hypothetical protein
MRTTPPGQDRAILSADAKALRDCAGRLEALAGQLPAAGPADPSAQVPGSPPGRSPADVPADLPPDHVPDWAGILAALARRCRVAAAELETAADLRPESGR